MPQNDGDTLRELLSGYHKLGVAVSELSVQISNLEKRLALLETAIFHGTDSLKSDLAVTRSRLSEQQSICRETRSKYDAAKTSDSHSKAMVAAAVITGVLGFLAAVASILMKLGG